MASLSLDHVSKIFHNRGVPSCAVNDLSLETQDGELIVLVGPSGCGKSTTLRMIAGLEDVSNGSIHIEGQNVSRLTPKDRDVAMVFQNYALYPHMTVSRNLAFGLKMRRMSKSAIDKKVKEATALLGLDVFLDRKPGALSGGECQRVAVGRALIRNPKLFLLDEPLSNLDPTLRRRMRFEIKELQRKLGITMIYVTHDQEEAMTLGDSLVVLREGRIQQQGRPLDVYRNPANRFVAEFIGAPTINILHGLLQKSDRALFLCGKEFRISIPTLRHAALEKHAGSNVAIGIRPEQCQITGINDSAAGPSDFSADLPCRISVIEQLGDRMVVYLTGPDDVRLAVATSANASHATDDEVVFRFDPAMAHYFDINGRCIPRD